jgi:hypothetical protein
VDQLGFAVEAILDLIHRLARLRRLGETSLHALDRPEQVDRRRPSRRHQVAGFLELRGELLRPRRAAFAHAEREAHRRGDANRGSAANDHGPDRTGHVGGRLAAHVDFLGRQLTLVDHDDHVVFARDSGEH